MPEGPLVFVGIDTQRDFLEPAGALYVPDSVSIVPNLARLTEFARSHRHPILSTSCAHLPEDPELSRFPPHCMVGTLGQELVPETQCADSIVLGPDDRLYGEIPLHLTLQKRDLDLFSRPDADELIARYNERQPTFIVYGVATDYCVRAAVLGLLQRNCRVAIVVDAVRSIAPLTEVEILTNFALRGATLTVTDVVCSDTTS
jgi:nicotinamidase/pyrazinamidase